MELIGIFIWLSTMGGLIWGYYLLWTRVNHHSLIKYDYEPNNWGWVALFTAGELIAVLGSTLADAHKNDGGLSWLNALIGFGIYLGCLIFAFVQISRKTNWRIALASVFAQVLASWGAVIAVVIFIACVVAASQKKPTYRDRDY